MEKDKEENGGIKSIEDSDISTKTDSGEETVAEEEIENEDEMEEESPKKDLYPKKTRKLKKDIGAPKDFKKMFFGLGGDKLETGIYPLDIVLGGGYEKGDWIEISSESNIGKTTLLLDVCRRALKNGMTVAYIDVEAAVKSNILKNMGVSLDLVGSVAGESKFFITTPYNFVELEEIFETLLYIKNPYDIIVIDSLSNVMPWKEDMSVKDKEIGLRARQEGNFFTKFKGPLRRSGSTIFMVNQMRVAFKGKGIFTQSYMDSTSGNSAKHNCDVRLRIEPNPKKLVRKEKTILGSKLIKDVRSDDETVYGSIGRLKAIKNRNNRPEIPVDIHVIFGQGISNIFFLETLLVHHEFIKIKTGGSWKFSGIPSVGESNGKLRRVLRSTIRDNEIKIVEFLKENGYWSLVQGVEEE